MEEVITYVGLDVHKEQISVGIAAGGCRDEARYYGRLVNNPAALRRLSKKLSVSGGRLRFCYEAGPCGYGIYRDLRALGHDCVVVAPSLIPRRPGDRVKTDRRDCLSLALLDRSGSLTSVWVPDSSHEALRDLVRSRAAASRALRRARQQLLGFLLRQGRVRRGKNWTLGHRRWLSRQRFAHPAQQIVLEEGLQAIEEAEARVSRLTAQIGRLAEESPLAPLLRALQSLRGVALVTAATLLAEVGDLTRFASPRQLMAHLGLVPSETSSGGTVRRGGITKAGNSLARSVLMEAAWCYRFPARVSIDLRRRQEGQPKAVRELSWKAQVRLCGRYSQLRTRGKDSRLVSAAVARELLGFIWAIAQLERVTKPA